MDLDIDFVVRRPVAEVFAAWADLERAPEWAEPVLERRKLTAGPVGVGTRFRARDRFPGRTIEFDMEIVAHDPERLMAAEWFEPMKGGWEARFSEHPDGTAVSMKASMTPTGALRLMAPLISRFARRAITKDMAAFAAWVEKG